MSRTAFQQLRFGDEEKDVALRVLFLAAFAGDDVLGLLRDGESRPTCLFGSLRLNRFPMKYYWSVIAATTAWKNATFDLFAQN